jgi:hypothetical protein
MENNQNSPLSSSTETHQNNNPKHIRKIILIKKNVPSDTVMSEPTPGSSKESATKTAMVYVCSGELQSNQFHNSPRFQRILFNFKNATTITR